MMRIYLLFLFFIPIISGELVHLAIGPRPGSYRVFLRDGTGFAVLDSNGVSIFNKNGIQRQETTVVVRMQPNIDIKRFDISGDTFAVLNFNTCRLYNLVDNKWIKLTDKFMGLDGIQSVFLSNDGNKILVSQRNWMGYLFIDKSFIYEKINTLWSLEAEWSGNCIPSSNFEFFGCKDGAKLAIFKKDHSPIGNHIYGSFFSWLRNDMYKISNDGKYILVRLDNNISLYHLEFGRWTVKISKHAPLLYDIARMDDAGNIVVFYINKLFYFYTFIEKEWHATGSISDPGTSEGGSFDISGDGKMIMIQTKDSDIWFTEMPYVVPRQICEPSNSIPVQNEFGEYLAYHESHTNCINECIRRKVCTVVHVVSNIKGSSFQSPFGCFFYSLCKQIDVRQNDDHFLYILS